MEMGTRVPGAAELRAPEAAAPQGEAGGVRLVPLERLVADPDQARKTFPEKRLAALERSIQGHGILQPILVRPLDGGRFGIIAGERRYRAGLRELPCVVREYSAEECLQANLIENIHRDGLSDIDKSDALVQLKKLTGLGWKDLAAQVQLSEVRVRQLASLRTLHERVKAAVRGGQVSGRVARALKPLPPAQRVELLEQAIAEELTAETVRARVRERLGQAPQPCSPRTTGPVAEALLVQAEELTAALEQCGSALTAAQREQLQALLQPALQRLR
jgi:ParB family transcriptional regulator, chromosome partitioning protein